MKKEDHQTGFLVEVRITRTTKRKDDIQERKGEEGVCNDDLGR